MRGMPRRVNFTASLSDFFKRTHSRPPLSQEAIVSARAKGIQDLAPAGYLAFTLNQILQGAVPSSRVTNARNVGLPRESRISRALNGCTRVTNRLFSLVAGIPDSSLIAVASVRQYTVDKQCLAHKLVKAHLNIGNSVPAKVSMRKTGLVPP